MSKFKFSVGPWNVHTGADSYGPETRNAIDLETKFANFRKLGFDAVQFHDDDVVPNMNNLSEEEIKAEALNNESIARFLEGKEVVKVIVVKGRLVNLIVK